MDPITGVIALSGISLASLIGLRIKRNMQEGFAVLPATNDGYPDSIETSQSRYNELTGMVNPLINGVIPVGTDKVEAERIRNVARGAFGKVGASFDVNNSQTLRLGSLTNKTVPRNDTNESIFGAIQFCREAGKDPQPFTVYNKDGSVKSKGRVSADGNWDFDEVCGVCLSRGLDEEGRAFTGIQGMVLDPNTREQADKEKNDKGYPYSRIIPPLATCEGAPNEPVFAGNGKDLALFQKRWRCIHNKQIGTDDECGLCYENDSYTYVSGDSDTNQISLVLLGSGTASVSVREQNVASFTMDEKTSRTVQLKNAKEGDVFRVVISKKGDMPTVWGYLTASNPNGGTFTMPLNLLAVIDDNTGSVPTKSGAFYYFDDVGLDVAAMRSSRGNDTANLRGTIPFTFVAPDEFSAIDCPAAPFQTKIASVSAFATDQPCFAKGTKPGKYNDECLKQRILDVGCTNSGTLYDKPGVLNMKDGIPQNLQMIHNALLEIADLDMIDPAATKMCSGRSIETPCDPFIARPEIKIGAAVYSDNPKDKLMKDQALQCLSYLYNNKGASETGPSPRVGPTYSGLVRYANNQREKKNIYCLPEGELNPDNSEDALKTLATVADRGYRGQTSVAAIKKFLNEQLEMAADMTRNANTDPDRKAAIKNCFGKNLNALKSEQAVGEPTMFQDPCGVTARYVRIKASKTAAAPCLQIAQLVVVDKNGQNVALNKRTQATKPNQPESNAQKVVDGTMGPRSYPDVYHSQGVPPTWQCSRDAFWMVDLGDNFDIVKIIYYNRYDCCQERAKGMILELLDQNKAVVKSVVFPSGDMVIPFNFRNPDVEGNCASGLKPAARVSIPSGYAVGLFTRFFALLQPDPSPDPTNNPAGWGDRIGSAGPYLSIDLTAEALPDVNKCLMSARGYYLASGSETIYFATHSDDGIIVKFNGQTVISRWNPHGPTADTTSAIAIPRAGMYPIEINYFQGGGGALCKFFWRTADSDTWTMDLKGAFVYDVASEQRSEDANAAAVKAKQEAERRAIFLREATLMDTSVLMAPQNDIGYPPGGFSLVVANPVFFSTAWLPGIEKVRAAIAQGIAVTGTYTSNNGATISFPVTGINSWGDGNWASFIVGSPPMPPSFAGTSRLAVKIMKSEAVTMSGTTYKMYKDQDRGGADIECFFDGRSDSFCKEKCDNDPNCKSYNNIHRGGRQEGCCYKTAATPISPFPGGGVDLYVKQ